MDFLVAVVDFSLDCFKQVPGCGGKIMVMCFTNYVECLSGTVFNHAVSNDVRESSAVQGSVNNILARYKGVERWGGGGLPVYS